MRTHSMTVSKFLGCLSLVTLAGCFAGGATPPGANAPCKTNDNCPSGYQCLLPTSSVGTARFCCKNSSSCGPAVGSGGSGGVIVDGSGLASGGVIGTDGSSANGGATDGASSGGAGSSGSGDSGNGGAGGGIFVTGGTIVGGIGAGGILGAGGSGGGRDATVTGGAVVGGIGAGGIVGVGGSGGGPDAAADVQPPPPDVPSPLAVGAACLASSDCALGNCIDGFCCDKACVGCNACKQTLTGKPNGTCAPATSGLDPRDYCTDETATKPCGNDGTCDGAGACRKVGNSHVCTPASCNGLVFTPDATCDGAGTCLVAKTQDCTPFQCALTGCKKTCTTQADCDSTTSYCDTVAGTCAAKLSNGKPATSGSQCTSGVVADGVCCNLACGGCSACTSALNGQAATTTGQCLPVVQGTAAPHNACTASPPCGLDGTCDGSGNCHYTASATSCATNSCVGSTLTTSACNSAHACIATGNPCAPYMCATTACKTSCTVDGDCVAGNYCSAGVCKPKLQPGSTCTSGSQCANGTCADGVCCDSPCTGACQSCALASSLGTCSYVSGSPAPNHPACAGTGTCGGTCNGQSAACSYPDSQTTCVAAGCASGAATDARFCNGAGTCSPGSTSHPCSPYACGASACLGSCLDNSQCVSSAACVGGACTVCTAGQTVCPGLCVNLQTSNAHCGACSGAVCGSTQQCAGGKCLLANGQACSSSAVCASGTCNMFYQDSDGDGYPVSTISVGYCNVSTSPVSGYIPARSDGKWDCCDTDRNAHPGQTAYFTGISVTCGWDYDCSGTVDKACEPDVGDTCVPDATYPTQCIVVTACGIPNVDCGGAYTTPALCDYRGGCGFNNSSGFLQLGCH